MAHSDNEEDDAPVSPIKGIITDKKKNYLAEIENSIYFIVFS